MPRSLQKFSLPISRPNADVGFILSHVILGDHPAPSDVPTMGAAPAYRREALIANYSSTLRFPPYCSFSTPQHTNTRASTSSCGKPVKALCSADYMPRYASIAVNACYLADQMPRQCCQQASIIYFLLLLISTLLKAPRTNCNSGGAWTRVTLQASMHVILLSQLSRPQTDLRLSPSFPFPPQVCEEAVSTPLYFLVDNGEDSCLYQ